MSLFGKKSGPPPEPEPTPRPAPKEPPAAPKPPAEPSPRRGAEAAERSSWLGPGCTLEGEIHGKGTLKCHGNFHGTIDVDGDVVIGREGDAKAELSGRRIVIEGRFEGRADGLEKVEVSPTGHVEGYVRAPAVMFHEGAFFEGNVEMRQAQDRAKKGQSSEEKGEPAADPGAAG